MKIIWIYRVRVDQKLHITTWRETYKYLKADNEMYYIFPYEKEKKSFTENTTFVDTISISYLKRLSLIINGWIAFYKLDKKVKPDLIILDHWSFFYPLIYSFRKRRPKVMVDTRSPEYNKNTDKATLSNRILKLYSRLVFIYNRKFHDGITFISNGLREKFRKDLRVRFHPVQYVWPSGVDIDLFLPAKPSHKTQPFTLFFHGSMTDNRGLAESVQAVGLLKEKGIPVNYMMIGGGKEENKLKNLARELGIEDQIQLLGYKEYAEIPAYMAQADLCMMAYPQIDFWEVNVPIKILEYMAMGKPVLCTELKVFKDMTKSGNFAVFIPNNDPQRIAEGIEYAINHQDVLNSAGEQARSLVSENYTWEAISDKLNQFFKTL